MNQEKMLSIKISIADRYYPLKIVAEDEERVRAAAVRINQKIEKFRTRFSGQDLQDALAMAALQFVMSLSKLEKEEQEDTVLQEIGTLNNLLEEYLQNRQ